MLVMVVFSKNEREYYRIATQFCRQAEDLSSHNYIF